MEAQVISNSLFELKRWNWESEKATEAMIPRKEEERRENAEKDSAPRIQSRSLLSLQLSEAQVCEEAIWNWGNN